MIDLKIKHAVLFFLIFVATLSLHKEFSFATTKNTHVAELLISTDEFRKLSSVEKNQYTVLVRKIYLDFEINALFGKSISLEKSRTSILIAHLISSNVWAGQKCLIGGVEQPLIGNKCSSLQNNCTVAGINDGFLCGEIFGEVCISRIVVDTISPRCEKASRSKKIDYIKIKKSIEKMMRTYCSNDESEKKINCNVIKRKFQELNSLVLTRPSGAIGGAAYSQYSKATIERPILSQASSSVASVKEECRAPKMFNLYIEGTNDKEGVYNLETHQMMNSYAGALYSVATQDHADNTYFFGPGEQINQYIAPKKESTRLIKEKINNYKGSNICSDLGKDVVNSYLPSGFQKRVPSSLAMNQKIRDIGGFYTPNVASNNFDLFKNDSSASLMKEFKNKISDYKKKCPDSVPLINMSLFGDSTFDAKTKTCHMVMNNSKELSPRDFSELFLKPFADQIVKFNFNFSQNFSHCFAEALKKEPLYLRLNNPCVFTSSSSNNPNLSSDLFSKNNRQAVYPLYLKKLKNPIYAQACALAAEKFDIQDDSRFLSSFLDNFFGESSLTYKKFQNPFDSEKVKQSLLQLQTKDQSGSDINDVISVCRSVYKDINTREFSKIENDKNRSALLQCPMIKSLLNLPHSNKISIFSGEETSEFEKFVANPPHQCDLNLNKYSQTSSNSNSITESVSSPQTQ